MSQLNQSQIKLSETSEPFGDRVADSSPTGLGLTKVGKQLEGIKEDSKEADEDFDSLIGNAHFQLYKLHSRTN